MTAGRQEYGDLYDLLSQTEEGTVSADGIARIDDIVQDNAELLQGYVEYIQLVSDLHFGLTNDHVETMLARLFTASDLNHEDQQGPHSTIGIQEPAGLFATQAPRPSFFPFLSSTFHATLGCFPEGMPLAYLIATVVTGLGLLIGSHIYISRPEQVARQSDSLPSPAGRWVGGEVLQSVGRITGMVNCKWAESRKLRVESPESRSQNSQLSTLNPRLLSLVSLGDRFTLSSGLVEITYGTGAKVILQGPVTYEVESNGGYLSLGKLTGKLETKAQDPSPRRTKKPSLFILHPSSFILSLSGFPPPP